jgi:dynein heavy chain
VKRLQKLIEVFSNIQQFDALAKLNLEKMDIIIGKFNSIRDQFKAKRKNDLLDLTHSNFDKEYVSFNISISQLDT